MLAEERSLREQAQSQVDEVKREWAAVQRAKDKREKELLDQLEAANSKLNMDEMAAPLISALQEEIDQLKHEHAVTIQNVSVDILLKLQKSYQQNYNVDKVLLMLCDHITCVRNKIHVYCLRGFMRRQSQSVNTLCVLQSAEFINIFVVGFN